MLDFSYTPPKPTEPTRADNRRVGEVLSLYKTLERVKPDPDKDYLFVDFMDGTIQYNGRADKTHEMTDAFLWRWEYSLKFVDYSNLDEGQKEALKKLPTIGDVIDEFGEYVEHTELVYHYPVYCFSNELNRNLIQKIAYHGIPKITHLLEMNVHCRAVSVDEFKAYAVKHLFATDLDIDHGLRRANSKQDDSFDITYFELEG